MHPVWFLLFDRFQLLDVCGPLQVFASLNDELTLRGRPPYYEVCLYANEAGARPSSCGVPLLATAIPRRMRNVPGTAIVPGGPGAWNAAAQQMGDPGQVLSGWVRRHAGRFTRIASVCTGGFVLARAGLLDGRQAVTHWAACGALSSNFPKIAVEPDAVYYRDDPYWTSAGVTAGIDMALGMVEVDCGRELAMCVAKRLVVFYKRPGGQSQFSSALLAQSSGDPRIEALHRWIEEHLRNPLTVAALAEQMAMTPRTFARFYVQQTGVTLLGHCRRLACAARCV